MGLSAFYGQPKPDAERFAILDAAYARGELFWDSADMYGDNEDLLGRPIFPSMVIRDGCRYITIIRSSKRQS
jgi:aryl-alcohol dehydrogenase-like predicted oxidoreductase